MGHKKMQQDSFTTAVEATVSAVAPKATYAGSAATVGGWIVDSNDIALMGLALAMLGFVANLFFKIREDRRREAEHKISMQNLADTADAHKKINEIAESVKLGNAMDGYSGMPRPAPKNPEPADESKPDDQK
jgi:hypothetical protein